MDDRQRLPDRRLCAAHSVSWEDRDLLVGAVYDRRGRLREIRPIGPAAPSRALSICRAACIELTRRLRCGLSIGAIAPGLRRSCRNARSAVDRLANRLAVTLAAVERLEGEAVRYAYRALAMRLAATVDGGRHGDR